MPLYDYKCQQHGVFQELAPMSEHDQPKPCPQCQQVSGRIIILPPEIAKVLKQTREAMERNEKSRESPEVMTSAQFHQREQEIKERQKFNNRHKHSSDCGCNKPRRSNLMYTAEGNKMFPGMRPWMISH